MRFFGKMLGKRQNEQQVAQAEMNALYEQCIKILSVELFKRSVSLVEERFPAEMASPIAAHIKLYCAGEGENERSLQHSTPEQRRLARTLANEIMALEVVGSYGIPVVEFADILQNLPDDPASIKVLALWLDQLAAIHVLSLATDLAVPHLPKINREFIQQNAVPLLRNAAEHDPSSAILQTTVAQTYYTLNDLETGFAAARKAVTIDPQCAEGWRLMGNGYMMLNDDVEARSCFARALSIDPNIDGVRQALALLS